MTIQDRIHAALVSARDRITDRDLHLATDLTIRYGDLMARQLTGEDVSQEIEIVTTALENIAVGAESNLGRELRSVVIDFVTGLLRGLVRP